MAANLLTAALLRIVVLAAVLIAIALTYSAPLRREIQSFESRVAPGLQLLEQLRITVAPGLRVFQQLVDQPGFAQAHP